MPIKNKTKYFTTEYQIHLAFVVMKKNIPLSFYNFLNILFIQYLLLLIYHFRTFQLILSILFCRCFLLLHPPVSLLYKNIYIHTNINISLLFMLENSSLISIIRPSVWSACFIFIALSREGCSYKN
jgi:hypothetical protein